MTGLLWVIVAIAMFAAAVVLAKAGTKKTEPSLAAGVSAIVFCIAMFIREKQTVLSFDFSALTIKQWLMVLAMGLIIGVFNFCIFKAIAVADSSVVVAVYQSHYVLAALAGALVYHNSIQTKQYISGALCIIGAVLVVSGAGCKKDAILFSVLTPVVYVSIQMISIYLNLDEIFPLIRFYVLAIGAISILTFTLVKGGTSKLKSLTFLNGMYLILAAVAYAFAGYLIIINSIAGVKEVVYYNSPLVLIVMLFATVTIKEKVNAKKVVGGLLVMASFLVLIVNK